MVIGLTGGIATGKSTVARLLAERGATVFSADEASRAVLKPGGKVLAQIAQIFGPSSLNTDGGLNRSFVGEKVFASPALRLELEKIVHPPLLSLLNAQILLEKVESAEAAIIVVEVPLLFEKKMQGWFDQILVVAASQPVQVNRLQERNGLTYDEALRRIASQMPLKEKIARAEQVISSEQSFRTLQTEVETLWREWKASSVKSSSRPQNRFPRK